MAEAGIEHIDQFLYRRGQGDRAVCIRLRRAARAHRDAIPMLLRNERAEIEAKGYSLTPGAYVGVPEQEDDKDDFHQRMVEIHDELMKLQEESNRLMVVISKNMKEMGI